MQISRAGNRHFPNPGFSLIELLVVLTIMVTATLAVAVAVPPLRRGTEIEATASGLASTLKKARMLAISREKTVAVTLDTASRRYSIKGTREIRTLPDSIRVDWHSANPGDSVRFYPDGSADNARLSLSDKSKRVALTVSPLTGRVSLLR